MQTAALMEIPVRLANHVAQKDADAHDYHISKWLECTFLFAVFVSKAENSSDTIRYLGHEDEQIHDNFSFAEGQIAWVAPHDLDQVEDHGFEAD